MKVIYIDANTVPQLKPSAAAIGYFDGFHTGHRRLVSTMLEEAEKKHLASAIITFDPDPWTVFRPEDNKDHLISLHDKACLAQQFGVDFLYVLHFDAAFASRTIESFHAVLEKMQVRELVCGYDFTYAFKGLGNVRTLQQQDRFKVCVVDEVSDTNEKISSTRIEKMIRAGLVYKAGILLGYYYSIPGVVVHGFHRGSDLFDMPTANLQPEKGYVLPANGVYAGYVYDGEGFFRAMINVGSNPTFQNTEVSVEAHIFHYSRNLYGRMVRFFFVHRLRPEIRFSDLDALRAQLHKDAVRSLDLLSPDQNLLAQTVDLWRYSGSFDILEK